MASDTDGTTCEEDPGCYPIPGAVCMSGTCRCPCGYRYIADTNGDFDFGGAPVRALCAQGKKHFIKHREVFRVFRVSIINLSPEMSVDSKSTQFVGGLLC